MFMNYYDKKNSDLPKGVFLLRFLIGILGGAVVFCALMCIFALILSLTRISDGFMPLFAGISIAGGSFFGGFLTARLIKSNGLRNGIICGAFYALIHILACIIFKGLGDVGALVFALFAVEICTASLGGIFGVNSAK
jgi:putative membrane protein, TIGR04086 family